MSDYVYKFNEHRVSCFSMYPPKVAKVHWDPEQPKFGVRVAPSGLTTYVVKYRLGSGGRTARQVFYTIGRCSDMSRKAARAKAAEIIVDAKRGIDAAVERDQDRADKTVQQVVDIYLEDHVKLKLKPTTQSEYARLIKVDILPTLGKMKIRDVTKSVMIELHTKKTKAGAKTTANRVRSVLSSILTFAEDRDWRDLGSNPVRLVPENPEQKIQRFLKNDEVQVLKAKLREAEAGREESTESAPDAARFLLMSGLRRGEVLRLRWENVAPDLASLMIIEHKTEKTDEIAGGREVHLTRQAINILKRRLKKRRENNAFVFPGEGANALNVESYKSFWRRMKVGKRGNDLRHTFASAMLSGGASIEAVGDALGHSDPRTTKRYAHLNKEAKVAAAARASEAFDIAFGDDDAV